MQQYIMDNRIILGLQGLRSVKKRDLIHSKNVDIKNTYGIQWNYKGSEGFMEYATIEERNNIFNEIKKAIKNRKEPHKPD